MGEYRDMKTGADVTLNAKDKKFSFPSTARILEKKRAPVAITVETD